MSSDLISVLELQANKPSKIILVKELNNCDSSFITSCVLSNCIKTQKPVLIVSFHNSLVHYHQVGLRMNYSLQKHVESGLITFYNLGEIIVENFLSDKHTSLYTYFKKLKEDIDKIYENYQSIEIIVEGISHLFDLDYKIEDVSAFCTDIIKYCRDIKNTFVLIHCNVACVDDNSYLLGNILSHKSHMILEVENLPSGLSTDVSGHIVKRNPVSKFQNEHMYNFDQKASKYLFKLFDKGVKLFAPGTV